MNSLSKLFVIFIIAIVANQEAGAQDIHFTQFYASPLTLNPAMTGMTDDCYRIALNYRNQYPELNGYGHGAIAGSFDMPILKEKLGNDKLGLGLLTFYDRAGRGQLSNLTVMASVAYHKALSNKQTTLSAGLQGGWVYKTIDPSKLGFEGQPNGFEFDPDLPSGESFVTTSINNFDLQAGLMVHHELVKDSKLYAGAAIFHLTEPTESFLGSNNTLDRRLMLHAGGKFRINSKHSINPNFIYMTQAAARVYVWGVNYGYHFENLSSKKKTPRVIYLGSAYRHKDAITVLLGTEFRGLKLGASYDLNILSDLQEASNGKGGLEVSLILNSAVFSKKECL